MAIRNNYRGNNMIRTTQKVSTMIGSVGATGATGPMPGLAMRFNTATNNADHDVGDVWLDAAAGSEVLLGIDDVDVDSNNIVARISVWDDSTTTALYGIVTIYQAADSANWIEMKITAVLSDQSGWTNFTVVHISKGGTIANNDLVYIDFNRSGDKGATGSTGLTGGAITGLDYNFATATADSDQGTGKVWLNHATRSSATVLYIDDNDNQSEDLSAFIAVWDDGTTTADRGYIKIQQRADNGIWSIFKISGASTDGTAYWKIAVTHIASAGSLTNTNPMDVFFTRSGNQGSGLSSIIGDTSPQLGGFLDPDGNYIGMDKGGDITSATPLVIDVDGDYFVVTGTTGFSAMTVAAGRHFFLEFAGILTIVHGSGTTDIPGGANYTSAAGDVIECVSTAANTVTIVGIELISGKAQVESVTLANSVTLTNKTLTSPVLTSPVVNTSLYSSSGDLNIGAVSGSELTFQDDADRTKETILDQGGATGSRKLTLITSHTDNRSITFPNATDTLVGKATTDTFTNKTIVGANNTVSITKGIHTIYIPAGAMKPTTSNGCAAIATVETTAGRPDMNVLDFDKDADEHAQFNVCFPKSWNLGTITYQVFWAGLAATTGVAWGLQGVAVSDNTTIDVAYGSIVLVTDDAQGAVEELLVTAISGDVTIAGSPADNDLCYFRIFRDITDGNDDMAGDARLLGVKLFFTTDLETDD